MLWKKEKTGINEQIGLLSAFFVTLVVNGLAGSTNILGGVDTSKVSDSYPNLFAPSGVTFTIWAVIYLLLAGFVLYAFGVGRSKKSALRTKDLRQIVRLATINLLLNTAWLFAWQYKQIWLSVIIMVGLLVTLAKIVNALRDIRLANREYIMAKLPFSVYFGWITVATIANITTWLVSINWSGFGIREGVWMVATLIVGAAIGVTAAIRNNDIPYMAVFVWAYAGILLKHLAPGGFNGRYPSTIITLTILIAVFVSTIAALAIESRTIKQGGAK